ncbi:MAG: hypothetical protein APR63_04635 [Desulfuromonas sp. SDB]|nr:MAG: hypothetical protein APR63_04635 [Desulfuromonas sp. SDB]
MDKNIILADKLFDQKRYYEAVAQYEGNKLNPVQLEKLAVCYAKTDQFSKATKLTSELIENYRLSDKDVETIAMYLVHFEYCPELTSPFLLTYTEIAVRNKVWNQVIDMIKQCINENLDDPGKVVDFLKSIKKQAKVGDYIIDLIDNLVSRYDASMGSNEQMLKDDSAQSEFSLPEFFESIGSYENAVNAYIKIGKWAVKVNKPNLIRKSLEALERLGYQDNLEYIDLKESLDKAGPVFDPHEIIKGLPEKTDDIPMELADNHLKLALLLNIRGLADQTKTEFLNSVLATPILDQQEYVEKLYAKLKMIDADLTQEVMNYIASTGQFSYELQETIKSLSHPTQGLDRFVKSESGDQTVSVSPNQNSDGQDVYDLDSLLNQEAQPPFNLPESKIDETGKTTEEQKLFSEEFKIDIEQEVFPSNSDSEFQSTSNIPLDAKATSTESAPINTPLETGEEDIIRSENEFDLKPAENLSPDFKTETESTDHFPLDLESSQTPSDFSSITADNTGEQFNSDGITSDYSEEDKHIMEDLKIPLETDKVSQYENLTDQKDFMEEDDIASAEVSKIMESQKENEIIPSEEQTDQSAYSGDQSEGEQENQLDEMNIDFL